MTNNYLSAFHPVRQPSDGGHSTLPTGKRATLPQTVAYKYHRLIAWVSGLLTVTLVGLAFTMSYTNMVELATAQGIAFPQLFPWVVEFGVIVFSANVLRKNLQGEQTYWGWSLIIGSSLLATVFNVLHAQPNLVSQVMHAVPSLFMLLSFETFLTQIREIAGRSALVASRQALAEEITAKEAELSRLEAEAGEQTAQIGQYLAEIETLQQAIKAARAERQALQTDAIEQAQAAYQDQRQAELEERRLTLLEILYHEGDIGATAFAHRLDISKSTIYNDLKSLADEGLIHKNGAGWAVSDAAIGA